MDTLPDLRLYRSRYNFMAQATLGTCSTLSPKGWTPASFYSIPTPIKGFTCILVSPGSLLLFIASPGLVWMLSLIGLRGLDAVSLESLA